jgi:RNA polymerase sigma-70 factor (ECF subfamily)
MKFLFEDTLALTVTTHTSADRNKKINAAGADQAMGLLERLTTSGSIGKRREFERQINACLEPTLRLATRLTGNIETAEELVQETMLRAVRNWESFRGESQFKTWLYQILVNTFRDQLRRQQKVEFTPYEDGHSATSDNWTESAAHANELSEKVAQLIAQLPQRQREVLVLSTYETMKPDQIAATLQISVANVHANLCMARRKLKQKLKPYLNHKP